MTARQRRSTDANEPTVKKAAKKAAKKAGAEKSAVQGSPAKKAAAKRAASPPAAPSGARPVKTAASATAPAAKTAPARRPTAKKGAAQVAAAKAGPGAKTVPARKGTAAKAGPRARTVPAKKAATKAGPRSTTVPAKKAGSRLAPAAVAEALARADRTAVAQPAPGGDAKAAQLDAHRVAKLDTELTTDQGIGVEDTDNWLRAGPRGPALLEDFHGREKIMRFDHERIPERVVHARGSGAHGYFQPYDTSLARYTAARFLTDPDTRTPVFVRFSTVQGSRGSTDTPRDVRGFAVKFYTDHGNFDLVGNNMPVFFIQDGIKFPDVIHAVKPEPHNEIPQAASAHDTFWDFVTLQPETMHHVIWLMSDRALPRSFRTMQGFGVHTFRLVAADGTRTFVKFHWTPVAGVHSLVWDEAQKISGKDPDFNRRDLWDSIEAGVYPEYELGVQLIAEHDEFAFDDIDLLDSTKLIPEEVVPVVPVGRMVLDRNPDNFFAETEQVAFCVQNIVPGIDFTDDPLLQSRLFSYLDTQLTRLGGPNFAQIPINRPLAPVRNHQQDGFHQDDIPVGQANYHPNSLGGGCPIVPGAGGGAFVHTPEHVDGIKERKRSETFSDHYSQATLFWNSMAAWEKEHIVAAYRFELGKVTHPHIRERMVEHLNHIDHQLAVAVAAGIGVASPAAGPPNHGRMSPALSQAGLPGSTGVVGRKVAVLVADGVDPGVETLREALTLDGAVVEVLGLVDGPVTVSTGGALPVDRAMNTVASVLYDAVVVADGDAAVDLLVNDGCAVHFAAEAYKHGKAIGVLGVGDRLVRAARLPVHEASDRLAGPPSKPAAGALDGVVFLAAGKVADGTFLSDLSVAIAAHRHFDRPVEGIAA
ncbi:catalase [Catellatospora citrea]|uniref:Catalase n=1 Tax=Catellatospora citrea TaxID=53366 RepID=A0A8J3KG61_9ACTN|nr:catalase [Catellatospora citrea]RKE00325.1 catalase [Catellatospora citrea]GIF99466.1 catalase [Catellatospora citrea]